MALDTYGDIWNRVRLRCPAVSSLLARDFVTNSFRRVAERRRWSWLIKYGQFLAPAIYNTGTVTVTRNSTTVTGSSTVWTSDMVGRQFRVATNTPIYTIQAFNSATSIELDTAFGGSDASGQSYRIYQCYFTPPSDFHSFLTVYDPAMNWQLWLNVQQQELNIWDAQRATTGQAFAVAFRDYTAVRNGIVASPLQVFGTGSDPTSSGSYSGPNDATFTVEVTTGGIAGVAQFRWKKDAGSYTSGVTALSAGNTLQDGVVVSWPAGPAYTLGDIWVVNTTAIQSAGLPRYEIWPHQEAQYVYPFLYESRPTDLQDANAVLPRYIRGDVLLEMALAEAAKWPGPSKDKPNPYYNQGVAAMHDRRAEQMIMELERQDDEVSEQDLTYQYPGLGWPMATPFGDSKWLQSHAI